VELTLNVRRRGKIFILFDTYCQEKIIPDLEDDHQKGMEGKIKIRFDYFVVF
jgi:hypothetical protein